MWYLWKILGNAPWEYNIGNQVYPEDIKAMQKMDEYYHDAQRMQREKKGGGGGNIAGAGAGGGKPGVSISKTSSGGIRKSSKNIADLI